MTDFQIKNPEYRTLLPKILAAQPFMHQLGVRLGDFGPGFCELWLDLRQDHLQHGGSAHGGVIGALADNAAGAASGTLMEPGFATVTVEYRISFLAPALGKQLLARGAVIKPGRAVLHTKADVFAITGDTRLQCATLLATMTPFKMSPSA